MAPAWASNVEPVQKPSFGRAPAGAAHGALLNRAYVDKFADVNIPYRQIVSSTGKTTL